MTAQAITTHDEPCPGCAQTDGTYWVTSSPDTDTWACRHCGTEWTITVHTPARRSGSCIAASRSTSWGLVVGRLR